MFEKKLTGLMGAILFYSVFLYSPLAADTVAFTLSPERLEGFTDASLEVRDFNQSGGPDIAVTGNHRDGTHQLDVIHFNDSGERSFEANHKAEGLANGALVARDLNGSSRSDLLVSGNTTSDSPGFVFLCNNFSGQDCSDTRSTAPDFVKESFPDSGLKKGSIAVAEVTGDTLPDVAVTGKNQSGTPVFKIYRQGPVGTFSLHSDTDTFLPEDIDQGLYNSALDWGNYDDDSYLDLAVLGQDANDSRHLYVFRNDDGSGLFQKRKFHSDNDSLNGLSHGDLAWMDYDSDGDSDLVVSGIDRENNPRFIFFENTGASLSVDQEPLGSDNGYWRSSLIWEDFDEDGDDDLTIMGSTQNDTSLDLYINDNSGDFSDSTAILSDSGFTRGDLDWSDFDGDGVQDLVVAGSDRNDSPSLLIALNETEGIGSGDGSDDNRNSCLIERSGVLQSYGDELRTFRDIVLPSRIGRWLTNVYYRSTMP